jgi:hypothetical protein
LLNLKKWGKVPRDNRQKEGEFCPVRKRRAEIVEFYLDKAVDSVLLYASGVSNSKAP